MFTDFIIKDKLSTPPKGPLIAEWINEVGYTYIKKYYRAIKQTVDNRDKPQKHAQ